MLWSASCESIYVYNFFLFSDSGLYLLNGLIFILIYSEWRDTVNQQYVFSTPYFKTTWKNTRFWLLRTVQLFINTVQKRGNWMQKKVIKQAFWLVSEQRSSQIANQNFCFQSKRAPWTAQLWRDSFPVCVIIKITWG